MDGNNSCEPDFDASTAQNFFKTVYSSEEREFHHPSWLPVAPSPAHPFDEGPLLPEELEHVIRRVRSSASPSPLDQIPYQVLRRCPSIRSALLHLFNICWAGRTVPKSWKEGVIRLIPKSAAKKAPHIPENFRPIALTSSIGKLYTSILNGRWLSFLMSNGYLDT